jgi:membrane protein DedA with SNARE-associated domain
VTEFIQYIHQWPLAVLALVFVISCAESLAVIGLLVPGIGLLLAISAVSGQAQLNMYALLLAGVLGAIVGDGLSFMLGRWFRPSLPSWSVFRKHPHWLKDGETFFTRYGGLSIFFGRFIGPLRPFIPLTAGMLGMSKRLFFTLNVLSALLWAPVYLLPGYLAGEYLPWQSWVNWKGAALLAGMTLLAIGCASLIHKKKKADV